jgi:hypothetical protein
MSDELELDEEDSCFSLAWVLERRHADGSWEGCCSEHSAQYPFDERPSVHRPSPAMEAWLSIKQMGSFDAALFSILSALRIKGSPKPDRHLATCGMPDDASPYARTNLSSISFEHYGRFTLGRLRQAFSSGEFALSPEHEASLSRLHRRLQFITGNPSLVDEALRGSWMGFHNDSIMTHPGMAAESAHERIDRFARGTGLLPVSDDAVRMVIAYRC